MASQVLHPKSCTASQGQRIWQTEPGAPQAARGAELGGVPWGAASAMGLFPPGVRASVLGTEVHETEGTLGIGLAGPPPRGLTAWVNANCP